MHVAVPVTRRALLRTSLVGLAGAILTACGPAVSPTATPAPAKPTEAPKPAAEPTKPAAATAQTPATPAQPTPTPVPAPQPAAAAPAKATGPAKLSVYTPYTPSLEKEMLGVFAGYHKVNPNVDFDAPIWGGDAGQSYMEGLLARVAAGSPPDATILWHTPVSLGVLGVLLPVDDMMRQSKYSAAENWPKDMFASCQFRGKTYGFPSFNAVYAVWYNQEALEQKGVPSKRDQFPKTWDEWRKVSASYTEWDGDKLKRVGFFPTWSYHPWLWTALNGAAPNYDAEKMRYNIQQPQALETAEYLVKWIDEEFKGSAAKARASGLDFWEDKGGEPAWQDGRLIMAYGGNFSVGMYKSKKVPNFRWDVAKFPTGPKGEKQFSNYAANWTGVLKGSKNPDATFGYLDWLNVEGLAIWSSTQPDLPANRKFDPNFVPQIVVDARGAEYAKDFWSFFKSQGENTARIFESPVAAIEKDQVKRTWERILTKAQPPKEALAEVEALLQRELEKTMKVAGL